MNQHDNVQMHIHACMHACIHAHTHVCVCDYIYNVYVDTYIHTDIHTYMCDVHTFVCFGGMLGFRVKTVKGHVSKDLDRLVSSCILPKQKMTGSRKAVRSAAGLWVLGTVCQGSTGRHRVLSGHIQLDGTKSEGR